jgi:surface polysaccharide O-acyltransferase-like enzyme
MITGALLLPQELKLKTFLQKRFTRLLIPFLFWSFIYILHGFIIDLRSENELSLPFVLQTIVNKLLYGSSIHLWYVYMLIGLYLFIPILGKWIRNSTEKEMIYFLIIWFVSLFINNIGCFYNFQFVYFSGYIGYLVLGYYLSVKEFKITANKIRIISILLFATGYLITLFGTYFLSVQQGQYTVFLYEYLTPNVVLASVGVFLFVKSFGDAKQKDVSLIINFTDKYSYGIYLVHMLVLTILNSVGVNAHSLVNPIISIPTTALLCLVISTLIIFIVKKIPFGKYISG